MSRTRGREVLRGTPPLDLTFDFDFHRTTNQRHKSDTCPSPGIGCIPLRPRLLSIQGWDKSASSSKACAGTIWRERENIGAMVRVQVTGITLLRMSTLLFLARVRELLVPVLRRYFATLQPYSHYHRTQEAMCVFQGITQYTRSLGVHQLLGGKARLAEPSRLQVGMRSPLTTSEGALGIGIGGQE